MIRVFLSMFTISVLVGCSTTVPYVSKYRIESNLQNREFDSNKCKNISLKVAHAFSPNALKTLNMNYAVGYDREYTYTQSQWADSPNNLITEELIEMLRDSGLFKSVQSSKSRSNSKLLLETNIEDFMQYFSADENNSYSNVAMTITLIDTKSNKIVSSKHFKNRVGASSANANGGVSALNKALVNVLSEVRKYMAGVCK